MLTSMRFHHLFLFIFKLNFIVKKMLSICKVLNCPLIFFCILINKTLFGCFNLGFSFRLYSLFLIWSKSFKMIWNISMRSKLGFCGLTVFCHNITHFSSKYFSLILLFLTFSPIFFSLSLFLGKF
jgi:hypothetical protein